MVSEGNKPRLVITVRARLIIGFMTLSLPVLLLIILLIPKVNGVIYLSEKIHSENLPQILDSQIYQAQDLLEDWAMTGNPEAKQHLKRVWSEINSVRTQWDKVMHSIGNVKLQESWDKLQEYYIPFYDTQMSIVNAPRDPNNPNNVENSRNKTREVENSMIDLILGDYTSDLNARIGGIYILLGQEVERNTNEINTSLDSLKTYAYWLLILSFALTLIVPYLTQQAIARPVDNAINIAERIAAGERDIDIQIHSADKLGKLLLSLKTMQEAIKKNEEILRHKEEESRELFEKLVTSSKKFRIHSSKVAAGDLRERLEIDREDILQDLGRDLNLMTDGLASITKKLPKSALILSPWLEQCSIPQMNNQKELHLKHLLLMKSVLLWKKLIKVQNRRWRKHKR